MTEILKHHPLPEHMPLNTPLVPNEAPRLWDLTTKPNLLVREELVADSAEELRGVSALLVELDANYGIKNSGYYPFLAGDTPKSPRAYILTNRVQGVTLDEAIDTRQADVLPALSTLYDQLTKYLEDKYVNGQKFMADIFNKGQYMYGRIEDEGKDAILLTDVGGETLDYSDDPERFAQLSAESVAECALVLYVDINESSTRTGEAFPALERVIKFLNSIKLDSKRYKQVISLVNTAAERGEAVSEDKIFKLLDS